MLLNFGLDGSARHRHLCPVQAEERRLASGETSPWRPDVPERPPPWEVDSAVTGLSRPGALSESLRKMGLM
jgi:hypothetical protein